MYQNQPLYRRALWQASGLTHAVEAVESGAAFKANASLATFWKCR